MLNPARSTCGAYPWIESNWCRPRPGKPRAPRTSRLRLCAAAICARMLRCATFFARHQCAPGFRPPGKRQTVPAPRAGNSIQSLALERDGAGGRGAQCAGWGGYRAASPARRTCRRLPTAIFRPAKPRRSRADFFRRWTRFEAFSRRRASGSMEPARTGRRMDGAGTRRRPGFAAAVAAPGTGHTVVVHNYGERQNEDCRAGRILLESGDLSWDGLRAFGEVESSTARRRTRWRSAPGRCHRAHQ